MWAIVDARAPKQAIDLLAESFNTLEFSSQGLCLEAISGHPDIFVFVGDQKLIISKNSPPKLVEFLKQNKIEFTYGSSVVGKDLASSTPYNCWTNNRYFFHKTAFTDPEVLKSNSHKELINVNQGFTRCSMFLFDDNTAITSDRGLYNSLTAKGFDCLLIDDSQIQLPGFKNGFFGGCCGQLNGKFYLMGSLAFHSQGNQIKDFIQSKGLEIVELYKGPMLDVGGIILGV